MAEDLKPTLILLAIVAIVAIVGIVVMVTSSVSQGQGYSTTPVLVETLDENGTVIGWSFADWYWAYYGGRSRRGPAAAIVTDEKNCCCYNAYGDKTSNKCYCSNVGTAAGCPTGEFCDYC
ncbi:MAG: hypothetical protein J7K72_02660 [Candidatus Aenigmarchaeota archaeon]|nr:hypothetical protein [Candidatus Aenigmarchaeota archaeon]